MKVTWLNEDCTRARLVRGWFRKRQAVVTRHARDAWYYESGELLPYDLRVTLERARSRGRDWKPVPKLPPARLLKG